ncbi:MAG: VWA domain-containing protein [Gemmataceae bacterium]|nr:VWA domain-containing protein [Gemmataceae bacterium]
MLPTDGISHQLPSSLVAREFGEVNVRRTPSAVEVQFTILMEPQGQEAEGWQTGVALDGSASMRDWYGQTLLGKVPREAAAEYRRRGWITEEYQDGRKVMIYEPVAYDDAIRRGYLRYSENIVQPAACEFIAYLAGNLDADGGTTVIYWACGDGSACEVLGDFTTEQCRSLTLIGPRGIDFGTGTYLLPAVRYFVERFKDAERGMYVFLTDGRLDDLEAVKRYTTQLAREIQAGKRHAIKCVLIGVGDHVDESQMEALDDLDTGTSVDIWDHKIRKEMRDLKEIFAEVVDENQIVAPTARIFDAHGRVVKTFADGLPAKASFTLPPNSPWFELEVADQRIQQTVVLPR